MTDATKTQEIPNLQEQEGQEANRGEKKCKKALLKIGMKQLAGITRVTLKKRDGLIFVIDDPEVLNIDNSYAIFGELKLEDLNRQMQMEQAKKFASQAPAEMPKVAPVIIEDEIQLSEEGLTASHITMVMDHAQCTRNQAIKALRETSDDMVQAVMKLTT